MEFKKAAAVVGVVARPRGIQVHVADDHDAGVLGGDRPDRVVEVAQVLLLLGARPLTVNGAHYYWPDGEFQPEPDVHGGGPDDLRVVLGGVVLPEEQDEPVPFRGGEGVEDDVVPEDDGVFLGDFCL